MIDYDKFGHCVKCHKSMVIEEVIEDRPQRRFTAEYSEKEYILNDGSKMRVVLCINCKSSLKPEDSEEIMNCVIKGWDKETDELVESPLFPKWDKERKDIYMEEYSKKKIIGDS